VAAHGGAQRQEDCRNAQRHVRRWPFALQHGAGVIKFRKVAIKPQ
jgi:hypothetical protein